MKIEFLLLPEYGEQSEQKREQFPLFYPPQLGGAAEERGHCLHIGRIVVLQLWHSLIRPADGRALSGAARGMLKLLLPTGQSKS